MPLTRKTLSSVLHTVLSPVLEVLGSDILLGWDFTSGWTETDSSVTDADSFDLKIK